MNNCELRDEFVAILNSLKAGTINPKDAAQRNIALGGILKSATLDLQFAKLSMTKPALGFWQAPDVLQVMTDKQIADTVRANTGVRAVGNN